MHPPIQDQLNFMELAIIDPEQFAPSVSCTAEEDKARQEFKNEADVNWLLRKYGALPPVQSFPIGEVDFDQDLLSARIAISQARDGYYRLPDEFRSVVSFDQFLSSLASGEAFPPNPVAPKAEVSSAAGGTSQA